MRKRNKRRIINKTNFFHTPQIRDRKVANYVEKACFLFLKNMYEKICREELEIDNELRDDLYLAKKTELLEKGWMDLIRKAAIQVYKIHPDKLNDEAHRLNAIGYLFYTITQADIFEDDAEVKNKVEEDHVFIERWAKLLCEYLDSSTFIEAVNKDNESKRAAEGKGENTSLPNKRRRTELSHS